MKSCSTLVLLFQFALVLLHGFTPTAAAPVAWDAFTAAMTDRENEIPSDKIELMKHFRETYALRVKSLMNATVDPCVDFYEYACGNFSSTIKDYGSEQKRSNLLDIEYTILEQFDRSLTRQRDSNEMYFDEMQTAKQYMESCVSAKLWPREPSQEYLDVLKQIGGFPAVDPTWSAAEFDWFKMTAHLSRYGIVAMVHEAIFMMHPFPPYYKLPKYGFDFDVYLENIETKQSPGYVYNEEIMKNILAIYGVNGSKADQVVDGIVDFWRKALELEESLQAIGGCQQQNTLAAIGLQDSFDKWMEFFDIAWNSSQFVYTETSECPCHYYYTKLNLTIHQMPEAAANYMALKFLYSMHPKMKSGEYQRLYCLKLIKAAMPHLVSHFYLKEHYMKENEEDIFDIISELKRSLMNLMRTADWLDEPTKEEALKKGETLRAHVGKIDDPISDTLIKEIRKLKPSEKFSTNMLELTKFNADRHHYLYLHPEVDKKTSPLEIIDAAQTNAFHYVLDNSINVLAGILNPPVYHPHMPQSSKYGALGYILGHELTHTVSSSGAYFDSDHKFRRWWSANSTRAYEKRSKCFEEHYSNYKVPELNRNLNGTSSLDENVADSGGLREAFAAYKRVRKFHSTQLNSDFERRETLPGFNLSPEQNFFLSFAQVYCSKYTPKILWSELDDDHPLNKYRVIGSLQNFEEFSKVYNCAAGSPMNPVEKCRLW